jgi:hypothetical protein
MTLQRLAAKRLLEGGAAALTALLLAGPLVASPDQSRQRPSDSGSGGRTAIPRDSSPSAPSGGSGGPSASGDSGRSHDSSPPRTAQPSPGAGDNRPERQRPHRRDGDGGGHGGHGGYYYGDGWYRPWYGYGWWGYGWYGGYPYPYYGPGGYPYYSRPSYDNDLGALDLDVSPGRAQVYLDGRYIGTVDAYDGFPRYLWLERGTYDLVLFLDGYRTVARQVSVYPGTVLGINDQLEQGESTPPEEMVSPQTHERRDARIREERERREQMGRGDRGGDDEWRDRIRDERRRRDGDVRDEGDDRRDDDRADRDDRDDRATESRHGNVRLDIEPRDASVYLDGRFVGTGEDLKGFSVNPGRHQLAVVRPGYESKEQEFDVTAGENVVLEVELEEN